MKIEESDMVRKNVEEGGDCYHIKPENEEDEDFDIEMSQKIYIVKKASE